MKQFVIVILGLMMTLTVRAGDDCGECRKERERAEKQEREKKHECKHEKKPERRRFLETGGTKVKLFGFLTLLDLEHRDRFMKRNDKVPATEIRNSSLDIVIPAWAGNVDMHWRQGTDRQIDPVMNRATREVHPRISERPFREFDFHYSRRSDYYDDYPTMSEMESMDQPLEVRIPELMLADERREERPRHEKHTSEVKRPDKKDCIKKRIVGDKVVYEE